MQEQFTHLHSKYSTSYRLPTNLSFPKIYVTDLLNIVMSSLFYYIVLL